MLWSLWRSAKLWCRDSVRRPAGMWGTEQQDLTLSAAKLCSSISFFLKAQLEQKEGERICRAGRR